MPNVMQCCRQMVTVVAVPPRRQTLSYPPLKPAMMMAGVAMRVEVAADRQRRQQQHW